MHIISVIVFLFITLSHQACSKVSSGLNSKLDSTNYNSDSNQTTRVVSANCSLSLNATSINLNESVQFSGSLTYPGGNLNTVTASLEGTSKFYSNNNSEVITPEVISDWKSWNYQYTDPVTAGEHVRHLKFMNDQGKVICTTNNLKVEFVMQVATPLPANPTPPNPNTTDPSNIESQFVSLHQTPQTLVRSQSGETVTNVGFKNQFAPSGTPGCTMGIASLRSECVFVSDGLSFSLAGTQNIKQFKVFVPVGTKSFIFSSYLPQSMEAAVAVRMSSAPGRNTPLDSAEYSQYRSTANYSNVFDRLTTGQEVILVHSGGGGFSLAGNNSFPAPLSRGVWLYFRLINGDYVDTPRATYEIDLQKYMNGYSQTIFGNDGDPK